MLNIWLTVITDAQGGTSYIYDGVPATFTNSEVSSDGLVVIDRIV
jgi:hypothetical protein